MSARRDYEKLLRWYPREWRERYGDEFVALLEDVLQGAPPTLTLRASVARAAAVERVHATGLIGSRAPSGRSRAGSLLVFCAWSLFALAGVGLAKFSEHWQDVTAPRARALPAIAFGVVQALGGLTVVAVALGGAAAAPSVVRLVRRDGWPRLRRRVLAATAITAVAAAATLAIVIAAHSASPHERAGGGWPYRLAATAWAFLIAASVGAWTAAVVAALRRASLSPALIRLHARLAAVVSAALFAMTAATGVWWAALAADAPWFLRGAPSGSPTSPWQAQLVLLEAAMVLAAVLSVFGAARATAVLRHR